MGNRQHTGHKQGKEQRIKFGVRPGERRPENLQDKKISQTEEENEDAPKSGVRLSRVTQQTSRDTSTHRRACRQNCERQSRTRPIKELLMVELTGEKVKIEHAVAELRPNSLPREEERDHAWHQRSGRQKGCPRSEEH